MRWLTARSPVGPGGDLADTALFPWRSGDDALGSTLDEPVPAAVGPRVRRPFSADLGLLVARVVVGGLAVLDGTRLLVGVPGGSTRPVVEAGLGNAGFVRPDLLATYLGWIQLVGGILLLLGVFASLAAAALLGVALTAVGVDVPLAISAGATAPAQGPLLAATLAAVLVLTGPGRISGDAGRAWERAQTATGLVCLFLGVGTGLTVLLALR